jgi:hypothetical protein
MQDMPMDSDEREIFDCLKTWGADFVNAKEVCRRAGGKKRYAEDNDWAKPILQRMKERNILESDALGRYRIKPVPKKSGVEVENKGDQTAPDEHYEQL